MVPHSKNLPPSREILYLSLDDLLIIHTDQVERYGGSHGLRDVTLLESALFRPQSSFRGEDLYPSLFEKAAVLIHSLLLNHAFVDGNKRTSTAAVIVFLALNGYEVHCAQEELVEFALSIENKKQDKKAIASWLQKHSSPEKE